MATESFVGLKLQRDGEKLSDLREDGVVTGRESLEEKPCHFHSVEKGPKAVDLRHLQWRGNGWE